MGCKTYYRPLEFQANYNTDKKAKDSYKIP